MPTDDWRLLYAAAVAGAILLYLLTRLRGRRPFSVLAALHVKTEKRPGYIFLDMILSCVPMAGFVLIFLEPCSVKEAMVAGLGATGLLSAFGRESDD